MRFITQTLFKKELMMNLLHLIALHYDCDLKDLDRTIYENSECGAHIQVVLNNDDVVELQERNLNVRSGEDREVKRIILTSIVEGSDAEVSYSLDTNDSLEHYIATLEHVEREVDMFWKEAN